MTRLERCRQAQQCDERTPVEGDEMYVPASQFESVEQFVLLVGVGCATTNLTRQEGGEGRESKQKY